MLQKNDEIRLKIASLTFEGFGVGRYENMPVFVRGTAPGDEVLCRIVKVLSRYCYGIVRELLVPSPDRQEPWCDGSGPCGGCCYGHVRYDAELEYKRQRAADAFRLNCPVPVTVLPTVPSPRVEGYRNKIICPFGPDGRTGFYARNSHRVIPASHCRIQHPDFGPLRRCAEDFVREHRLPVYDEASGTGLMRQLYLRRSEHTGGILVCAVAAAGNFPERAWVDAFRKFPAVRGIFLNRNLTRGNGVLGPEFRLLWGEETLHDRMNGLEFEISPGAFYQINARQAERIYADLCECGLRPTDTVLDLYCGAGAIGLTLSGRVRRVVGVEVVPAAVENAKQNALRNGITNGEFYAADASAILPLLKEKNISPDVVVVDPPRKGLSEDTVGQLLRLAPRRIVYLSCEPATQARDAARLSSAYAFDTVQPYDMFPRTAHVETLVLMSRIAN